MKRITARLVVVTATVLLLAACDGGDDGGPSTSGLDPAQFQPRVDNPFFPLESGATFVYEGEETNAVTGGTLAVRVESTVLPETDEVAGIEVTVVEVKDFEHGELVESTLDYYAQRGDGDVYYLGERVDDIKDGEVVGHSGQWLAGEGENQAGIFMPAEPQVGDEFEQERASGIAEDRSTVVAVDETVETAAGTFSGCIKTEDVDPLGGVTEFKFYCRDVGLVREEFPGGLIDLVSR